MLDTSKIIIYFLDYAICIKNTLDKKIELTLQSACILTVIDFCFTRFHSFFLRDPMSLLCLTSFEQTVWI